MEIPKSTAKLVKELDINEYQLVVLLSKRTRELMFGAKPLIDSSNSTFTETAMQEILSGKIVPQV